MKLKLGISSCLTGNPVRMDGGHMKNAFCMNVLSEFAEFVPVCPEMSIGLPSPRPSIRLKENNGSIRVISADGMDLTLELKQFSQYYAQNNLDIDGFILAAKSPSCGMERVSVYDEKNVPAKRGTGIFAQEIMLQNPNLPVEEQGRLNDDRIRENFINRVHIYHEWRQLEKNGMKAKHLVEFHSTHKYLLMAHDLESYREAGKLLADLSNDFADKKQKYIALLMSAMKKIVKRKHHVNVLQHLQGYFKKILTADQKREFSETIENYRKKQVPLLVPITLIKHYLRMHPNAYLQEQKYLNPSPEQLALRYHL